MAKRLDSEYWSFKPSSSAKYAEIYSPLDDNGQPIQRNQVDNLPLSLTSECIDRRKRLGDIVKCVASDVILSHRAAELFRKFRMGNARFTPVMIVTGKHREPVDEVEVLTAPFIDFLDIARSSFTSLSKDPKLPLIITSFTALPVVHRDMIKDLDFAQSIDVKRICSNSLKEAIQTEEFTNFVFSPIDAQ